MLTMTYEALAAEWMALKTEESRLQADRIAVEQQLQQFFNLPEVGERSLRQGGFKTTMTTDLNISHKDVAAFKEAVASGLMPYEVLETKLYDTGFKRLRKRAAEQDPAALETYSSILPMFNVRPAKVGVTVVRYD